MVDIFSSENITIGRWKDEYSLEAERKPLNNQVQGFSFHQHANASHYL